MIKIKAFYVKEDDKPNKLKRAFGIVKESNDEIIIQKNLTDKRIIKVANKINKICKKRNVKNVVLSKTITNKQNLENALISNEIIIFDGRWLFSYMAYEIIDFIIKKTNKIKEETEITILCNFISDEVIENIKMFVTKFKRINIVTNHMHDFKKLEKSFYDEYGVVITITNNKKKSLAKAKIILNFDFVKEVLNKYSIYEQAIIINIEGNIKIDKKRFNGLVVNDYEIFSKRAEEYFNVERIKEFNLKDLLEARLYRKDSFINIRQDITKGNYKIKELYGNNGKLF